MICNSETICRKFIFTIKSIYIIFKASVVYELCSS